MKEVKLFTGKRPPDSAVMPVGVVDIINMASTRFIPRNDLPSLAKKAMDLCGRVIIDCCPERGEGDYTLIQPLRKLAKGLSEQIKLDPDCLVEDSKHLRALQIYAELSALYKKYIDSIPTRRTELLFNPELPDVEHESLVAYIVNSPLLKSGTGETLKLSRTPPEGYKRGREETRYEDSFRLTICRSFNESGKSQTVINFTEMMDNVIFRDIPPEEFSCTYLWADKLKRHEIYLNISWPTFGPDSRGTVRLINIEIPDIEFRKVHSLGENVLVAPVNHHIHAADDDWIDEGNRHFTGKILLREEQETYLPEILKAFILAAKERPREKVRWI